ncbi:hypothetical protein J6590_042548 [Homalodisca vitripennis]|nr:hypothetical protein J6590_042548 [Homalodisca vitripennis]
MSVQRVVRGGEPNKENRHQKGPPTTPAANEVLCNYYREVSSIGNSGSLWRLY